jgi:hypothetical protein
MQSWRELKTGAGLRSRRRTTLLKPAKLQVAPGQLGSLFVRGLEAFFCHGWHIVTVASLCEAEFGHFDQEI